MILLSNFWLGWITVSWYLHCWIQYIITFQALPANISWLFVVSFDTCCILLRKGPKRPTRVPQAHHKGPTRVPQGSHKGPTRVPQGSAKYLPRVPKGGPTRVSQGSHKGFSRVPQGFLKGPKGPKGPKVPGIPGVPRIPGFNKLVQQDVFGAVKPKKIDQKHCHAPGEHCSWKGGHFSSPRAESKLSPRWQAAQDHPRAFGDHCCESLNLWELLTSCPGQASQAVCSAPYDKKCATSAKGGISSYPRNWDVTPSTGFEFADFGFGKIRCVPTPFSCPILSVAVCELLIFIAWFHIFLSQIQGLLNVPFWVYWTSPYSSHYRPYT